MQRRDGVRHFLLGVGLVARRQVDAEPGLVFDLGDRAGELGVHEAGGRLAREEDAAVDRRIGAQRLLHLLLHGGDLPADHRPAELFGDQAGDAIGGRLVGRHERGGEAALLAAVAAKAARRRASSRCAAMSMHVPLSAMSLTSSMNSLPRLRGRWQRLTLTEGEGSGLPDSDDCVPTLQPLRRGLPRHLPRRRGRGSIDRSHKHASRKGEQDHADASREGPPVQGAACQARHPDPAQSVGRGHRQAAAVAGLRGAGDDQPRHVQCARPAPTARAR